MYLKNTEGSNGSDERKILYIPQNYLNRLSEESTGSRDTINKFVKDVLLQDETVRENYENKLTRIKGLTKLIPTNVADLYQIKQEIKEVEENIKQFGEENGIKTYIAQLKKEAEDIKSKSGLSNHEIKDYEALLEKETETTTSITVLSDDKKSLVSFKQNLMQQLKSLEKLYNEQSSYLGNDEIKKEFTKEFDRIGQLGTNLLTATDKVITYADSKIKTHQEELEKIKKELMPFMAKVKLQDELKKKNKAISDEQNKLNKINLEKKKLESKKDLYEKEKKYLIETYQQIFNVYGEVRNEFKRYENKFEDISLNVLVGFNEKVFNEEVIDAFLNKRDIKRNISSISWKDEYEYHFDPNKHLSFIS